MIPTTVNHEYFVAKTFSDSLAYVNTRKYIRNIKAVQDCLSENCDEL